MNLELGSEENQILQVLRSIATRLGPAARSDQWWNVLDTGGFLDVDVADGQSTLHAVCVAQALGEANAPVSYPAFMTARTLLTGAPPLGGRTFQDALTAWTGQMPPRFGVGHETSPGVALLDAIASPLEFALIRTAGGWLLVRVDELAMGRPDSWAGDPHQVRCTWDTTLWEGRESLATTTKISELNLLLHVAELVGVMRESIRRTLPYLHQRHQFDRPIGSFQALQHRAVDIVTDLRACEALSEFAAWRWGQQIRAEIETDPWLQAAAGLVCETSLPVLRECLQFHGGIAMTAEFWLHRWLRRAARLAVYDGGGQARFAALGASVRQGQRLVVGAF